jgi:GAF domain-containing protein
MKRRDKTAGKAAKTQRRKTLKRRNAPKTARRRSALTAGKETNAARLARERDEALDQLAATSEVLKVISNSPGELEPVFQAMLANAVRICGANFGVLFRYSDGAWRADAMYNVPPAFAEFWQRGPQRPSVRTGLGRIVATKQTIHIADVTKEPAYIEGEAVFVAAVNLGGFRTVVNVPMLKENQLIGCFAVYRQEVRPFTDRQIELVQNFAAQAVIAVENARLLSELRESLQQQTATGDILTSISGSMTDAKPVFDTIVRNLLRLFGTRFAAVNLLQDGIIHVPAAGGVPGFERLVKYYPRPIDTNTVGGLAMLSKEIVQFSPIIGNPAAPAATQEIAREFGFNSLIFAPMVKDDKVFGAIGVAQHESHPFDEKQIALIKSFANQAVIAIENARVFNALRQRTDDLSESLEQQTATSEVLSIISSSPGELQPVFKAMLANATRICEAKFGALYRYDGNEFHLGALLGAPPAFTEFQRQRGAFKPPPGTPLDRLLRTKEVIRTADDSASEIPSPSARLAGAKSHIAVPMFKDNELAGAIVIYRQEVRPFTDKQVELVQNFAAQAVIAIENTRLLSELRESLEQQTATSEVLQVISSSPGELEPVFNAMLENATRICEAAFGSMLLMEGDAFRRVAIHNAPPKFAEFHRKVPVVKPQQIHDLQLLIETKRPVHIADAAAVNTDSPIVKHAGARTLLVVPLLKDDTLIGAIGIYRQEVRPFTDKQIELVANFAAQAVIAIENTRLLSELRESLQQQTATADVLKVISGSAFELQMVFNTLVESAMHLCEAQAATIWRPDGNVFKLSAHCGFSREFEEFCRQNPITPGGRGTVTARVAFEGKIVHVPDVLADPQFAGSEYQTRGNYRSALGIPLLRKGETIGVFVLTRPDMRPYTEKQIELVKTFADQAVIAIENVRLFDELRESLQQQTATADVLKVISRSTFDLRTVLQTLVESAGRLCDADKALITREKNGAFYRTEAYGFSPEFMEYIKNVPIEADRGSAAGRALLDGRAVHIPDALADPEYTIREARSLGDFRTVLAVPMLREHAPIGVLILTRSEVRPFTDKQIELVATFADQAAIAIENVRLFQSVETRTRELAASLEDLRTTQDRLVQTQKLASLGQLTAGIAHEIKNPLNFVNNFSGVSAELIDELQEALGDVRLNEKKRGEITELMDTLRGNLDKVVQHGKRADAIVKNMLLHSRQGSGERRLIDVNALVEESFSLAYHGARAEKQSFDVMVEQSLDPAAGKADLFPQEITRVLLNLISNGVYATAKKAQANGANYKPTLTALTKSLGDRVEIKIRDNGTGIPPEIKDKMFSPFFTTKPAGEGTGLGLSISHDIIVKQHGGSIEVDTQPGEFTEIRIVLPRVAAP